MMVLVGSPFPSVADSSESVDPQDFKSRAPDSLTPVSPSPAPPSVVPSSTTQSSCTTLPSSTPSTASTPQPLVPSQHQHLIEFAGRYVILEPMEVSSLFHCVDKHTLRNYVCKIVPTRSSHSVLSGYLRMEGNPGINCIERIFVGPRHTYVLFPPSHGDLHSYVRSKKRLPESEAISLFHQIAAIVNDCHQNGICLRDLKLRKFVFRDPQQTQLKLETLDDAVVLEDADDDILEERHGCPAYASPEILDTNTKYSGRSSDCWSLGVILYTMLVGRYPFHDANPSKLLGKIRRGLFQVPMSVSPLVRIIIHSLLRKDPCERMTAEELLDSQLFCPERMQPQTTTLPSYPVAAVSPSPTPLP